MPIRKVLVTGNNGYIGSMLTPMLVKRGYEIVGLDTNYYKGCEFIPYSCVHQRFIQLVKDIRAVTRADLKNIDAVIHLAALSNDPLGELNPELTYEINYKATVKLAKLSKDVGVSRFLYASSCSMYGIAPDEDFVTEDAPLAPITPYAKSKVKSEEALASMAETKFSPIYLRPGTACGIAPMLRCDIVLNNLVGWAYTTGKIRILSDGTPWRPAIHVEDLCHAFIACLEAPIELIHNEAFNVGKNEENYRIRDMAEIVKRVVPNCEVEYTYEHGPDTRTYRVCFDKITQRLQAYFKPRWNLERSVQQLYEGYKAHGLTYEEFIGHKYIRVTHLKTLLASTRLNAQLYWQPQRS
jgi:nucleoside-diphosphate-sugar epimerase